MFDRLHQFADLTRRLGPTHAVRRKLQDAWHHVAVPHAPYTLTTKAAQFPLWCRPGTTDALVFWQVFIDQQYAAFAPAAPPRLILDCGANVGYTAAYFLTRFPGARVIAVEPDPGNAALLRRNVAPYGARATVYETAIWSWPVGLVFETTPFRSGGEWARQMREARAGETPALRAIDIPTLIAEAGDGRVSLLKMDIEGAETVVFSAPCAWLARVDALMVEVHDDTAERTFARAAGSRFAIHRHGELAVAVPTPAPGASSRASG